MEPFALYSAILRSTHIANCDKTYGSLQSSPMIQANLFCTLSSVTPIFEKYTWNPLVVRKCQRDFESQDRLFARWGPLYTCRIRNIIREKMIQTCHHLNEHEEPYTFRINIQYTNIQWICTRIHSECSCFWAIIYTNIQDCKNPIHHASNTCI